MINDALIQKLPESTTVFLGARMKDYTTFQLGGTVPAVIDCPDADALAGSTKLLVENGVPLLVIGQGSNLLVSDDGLDGVVLRYCSEDAPDISFEGCRVTVGGHTLLDDLAKASIEKGLGDISYCSGIPGTVGGAIAGNAGAFGQQIGDVVESVRLMNLDGTIETVEAEALDFAYRSSGLKKSGAVILDALIRLKPADVETMRAERERIMELRRTKHPDWRTMPCAGSVFRNIEPTSAAGRRQAAGWFLEEVGAKEFSVGHAHLFEKHANIIIADAGAKASDVYELTEKMISAVESSFGFKLEREIKLLGQFE